MPWESDVLWESEAPWESEVLWESGQEVYIKISYGMPNRRAICISFHLAEYPMNYPYKKGGKL